MRSIRGVELQLYSFFNLGALPPGNRVGIDCIGGWVRLRAGLDGGGKSSPPPRFDKRPYASL